MNAFSFGDILRALRAWWASLPKRRYLIAAIALALLGALIRSIGGFEKLEQFCNQMVADLGLFQPFNLTTIYFEKLVACDRSTTVYGDYTSCSSYRFLNPLRLIGGLVSTIAEVWSESGGPGRIFLPLALIATYPIAASMVISLSRRVSNSSEFTLIHAVLAAPLTPFIVSIVALVLQVLAIALFFVFGKLIGLTIWIATVLAGPWAVWKAAQDVKKSAKTMETAEQAITSIFASKPPDRDKPK